MSEPLVDRLRELLDKATPRPWRVVGEATPFNPKADRPAFSDAGASIEQDDDCFHYDDGSSPHMGPNEDSEGPQHGVAAIVDGGQQDEQGGAVGVLRNEDAALIVAAVNALPALLQRVADAERDTARLVRELDASRNTGNETWLALVDSRARLAQYADLERAARAHMVEDSPLECEHTYAVRSALRALGGEPPK